MTESRPRYVYEDHGHDVMDPDCVKCWMKIAHESQLAGAYLMEALNEVAAERDRLAVELQRINAKG
jgi:hypothetical protein